MRRDRAPRLGILGAILALICLGVSGEYAAIPGDSQLVRREGQVGTLAEGISEPDPVVSVPMMWGVQWTDTGRAGVSMKVQADAVSRRPRRVGSLTFESFQEIVATKVRVRIDGQPPADRDPTTNNGSEILDQLQKRLVNLYAMAQGGLHLEPDPANLFTQTFLSGVIFEDLVLEMVRDDGVGRMRIQTMSTAPEGSGWNLQGVEVEATDGRRLAIHEAKWIRNSRLVAYGPYSLEENGKRAAEPRGCFLVRVSNAVEIRGPIRGDAEAAVCTSSQLLMQGPSELPTMTVPFPEGGGVWPNKQMFRFVMKLPFLPLPAIPLLAPEGHRTDL